MEYCRQGRHDMYDIAFNIYYLPLIVWTELIHEYFEVQCYIKNTFALYYTLKY
jgi:hypothetical protein